MPRLQIRFPAPLHRRLERVAELNGWPLAEVVRRATELYVQRFPENMPADGNWSYPVIDMGGDFLIDPKDVAVEASVAIGRAAIGRAAIERSGRA